jgi:ABC-type glutathione transport system ATPase component
LADEPTGNLDRASAANVFDLLLNLAQESSTAVIVVTHDADLARVVAERDAARLSAERACVSARFCVERTARVLDQKNREFQKSLRDRAASRRDARGSRETPGRLLLEERPRFATTPDSIPGPVVQKPNPTRSDEPSTKKENIPEKLPDSRETLEWFRVRANRAVVETRGAGQSRAPGSDRIDPFAARFDSSCES